MARYTGASCRISRKYGMDFDFKTRDIETKCKFKAPPGQHGQKRSRPTEYGRQLAAKQMLKSKYLVLERQFRRFYRIATKIKGATGVVLLQLLERRLDNVVYRMGFAATRREARQLVAHKAVLVNGQCVNVASFLVSPNDEISIREKSRTQTRVSDAISNAANKETSPWVTTEHGSFKGIFVRVPERDELPQDIDEQLVVELYSK